jgi:hypothetical protein
VADADDPAPQVPRPLTIACMIIGLEALGLLVATGVLVAKAVSESHGSLARALLGAAFGVLGAAVLALCARGLLRLRPAARTPVVVLELLTLPIGYTIAFDDGEVGYGGPILIAALAVLYLLFTPPARAVLDREEPSR